MTTVTPRRHALYVVYCVSFENQSSQPEQVHTKLKLPNACVGLRLLWAVVNQSPHMCTSFTGGRAADMLLPLLMLLCFSLFTIKYDCNILA